MKATHGFDFKEKRVCLTMYSLKSDEKQYVDHLRNWVIEGSNTRSHWKILDTRSAPDLKGYHDPKTCECSHWSPESFRYLRLRQPGSYGGGILPLSQIEFFGTLSERIELTGNP